MSQVACPWQGHRWATELSPGQASSSMGNGARRPAPESAPAAPEGPLVLCRQAWAGGSVPLLGFGAAAWGYASPLSPGWVSGSVSGMGIWLGLVDEREVVGEGGGRGPARASGCRRRTGRRSPRRRAPRTRPCSRRAALRARSRMVLASRRRSLAGVVETVAAATRSPWSRKASRIPRAVPSGAVWSTGVSPVNQARASPVEISRPGLTRRTPYLRSGCGRGQMRSCCSFRRERVRRDPGG